MPVLQVAAAMPQTTVLHLMVSDSARIVLGLASDAGLDYEPDHVATEVLSRWSRGYQTQIDAPFHHRSGDLNAIDVSVSRQTLSAMKNQLPDGWSVPEFAAYVLHAWSLGHLARRDLCDLRGQGGMGNNQPAC